MLLTVTFIREFHLLGHCHLYVVRRVVVFQEKFKLQSGSLEVLKTLKVYKFLTQKGFVL